MPTCSEVKATSLGTDDIPFSFTSGNILKRASSMAYMLEIAPPRGRRGQSGVSPRHSFNTEDDEDGEDEARLRKILKRPNGHDN